MGVEVIVETSGHLITTLVGFGNERRIQRRLGVDTRQPPDNLEGRVENVGRLEDPAGTRTRVLGRRRIVVVLDFETVLAGTFVQVLRFEREAVPLEHCVDGHVRIVRRAASESETRRAALPVGVEVLGETTANRQSWFRTPIQVTFTIVVDGTQWPQFQASREQSTSLTRVDLVRSSTSERAQVPSHDRVVAQEFLREERHTDVPVESELLNGTWTLRQLQTPLPYRPQSVERHEVLSRAHGEV